MPTWPKKYILISLGLMLKTLPYRENFEGHILSPQVVYFIQSGSSALSNTLKNIAKYIICMYILACGITDIIFNLHVCSYNICT